MNVTETTQTQATQASTTQSASSASALSSDFETFLKMLTTQLQNQDPMNPMESSEFAVQLATFSGVEQQVRMNDQLGAISAQLQLGGLGQSAAWVGMEARAAAPAWFEGSPLSLVPDIESGADRAILVVSDSDGIEVQRLEIATSGAPFDWAGQYEDGTPLPDGLYEFNVESYAGDDLLGSTEAEHFARVTEVRSTASGPAVVLQGGIEVGADQVQALRDAPLG